MYGWALLVRAILRQYLKQGVMKWLFVSLVASLVCVFTLMALYIVTDDEKFKTYDNLGKAADDGAVKGGLIPETICSSASNIHLAFRPDSSNVFLSFNFHGALPLDNKVWSYTMNQEIQKLFCRARKHFNRSLFEGSMNYFELQNCKGQVIYLAVDRRSNTAYLSL
jgi:hypothetical protein